MNVEAPRTILVVEDDAAIRAMIENYLRAQGFAPRSLGNGLEVATEVRRLRPALVLLDLNLPGQDGIAACRELRRFCDVPIIMLTARVDEIDRLLGLEVGADDYVCKPFSPRELVARMRAQLRRAEGLLPRAAGLQGFEIDEGACRIAWQGQPLGLTPVEFRLLRQLLQRPGQVLSRARLLDSVHDDLRETTERAIDSHIKNIRRKIELLRPQGSGIASVYGLGYRFEPDDA